MTCRRTRRAPWHGGTPRGASLAANSGQVFDTAYKVGADPHPHPEPLRTLQHR
ncbi:hypothetical protein AB0O75_42405 [Streptomyces sp. NPDC088921]|uniref:hypothetical protein n=1 Tax=unclassified Streptomyces TaxID=2593676 RepID=UPI00343B2723